MDESSCICCFETEKIKNPPAGAQAFFELFFVFFRFFLMKFGGLGDFSSIFVSSGGSFLIFGAFCNGLVLA